MNAATFPGGCTAVRSSRSTSLHFTSLCLMALFALSSGVSAQTITLSQSFCSGTTPCVLTYHNDNTRDGVNPNEAGRGEIQRAHSGGWLHFRGGRHT